MIITSWSFIWVMPLISYQTFSNNFSGTSEFILHIKFLKNVVNHRMRWYFIREFVFGRLYVSQQNVVHTGIIWKLVYLMETFWPLYIDKSPSKNGDIWKIHTKHTESCDAILQYDNIFRTANLLSSNSTSYEWQASPRAYFDGSILLLEHSGCKLKKTPLFRTAHSFFVSVLWRLVHR